MRTLFWGVAVITLAAALTFLTLPILAIFIRVPPGHLYGSGVALDALRVTAWTSLAANALFLVVGTPAAYLLATRRFPGRAAVLTVCELPLVLPPVVAGVGLLVAFGRVGILGDELRALGWSIPFTRLAVVLAVAFVAGPVYLRSAIAAFQAVDRGHLEAARTLGAGPARVFTRVAVPMAAAGLASGWAMAFARGLGEFGATLIFAGSVRGSTQTLTLAVYAQLGAFDLNAALAMGGLLVVFAAAVLIAVKLVSAWTHRSSTSISTSPAAGFPSG
ncbi:MAG: ABC transporter permease [Thermoleophilia bacterium]